MPRQVDRKPRISEPLWDKTRNKWRLIVRHGDGSESRPRFESEAEARACIESFHKTQAEADLTVEEALKDYKESQTARRLRESSIATSQHRLRKVLNVYLGLPIRDLTPAKAAACFAAYKKADTTRRSAMVELVSFSKWVVAEELGTDFAGQLVFDGRIAKGKAQLRRTEARLFSAAALKVYEDGDEAGLAVLLALTLGVRTGEVIDRLVSDVDDGGQLLWIDHAKTASGIRQIEVPPFLASLLAKQVEGKKAADKLFKYSGHAWVRDCTKRICRLAGVREITGQGLRGTFATLTISAGAVTSLAAAVLGHSDEGMTLGGNYAKVGSAQSGGAKKMSDLLQKGADKQDQARTKPAPAPEGDSLLH